MLTTPELFTTCFSYPHFIEVVFFASLLDYLLLPLNSFLTFFTCFSFVFLLLQLCIFFIKNIHICFQFFPQGNSFMLYQMSQHPLPPPLPAYYSFNLIYDLFCHADICLLICVFQQFDLANFGVVSSHTYTIL